MTYGTDYAAPSTHQNADGTHDFSINKGLTKREVFAMAAMQGMLANDWKEYKKLDTECKYLTMAATNYADALIEQLNITEDKG